MNRSLRGLLTAACLVAGLAVVLPAAAEEPPANGLKDVSWLAGCWSDGKGTQEQWMAPGGGVMLGLSRTLAGGRAVHTEFMQLRLDADGLVFSAALGIGKPATSFRRIADPRGAVFENPAHDFPQRVLYRREPDGSLFARIEGKQKGEEQGQDFRMNRAACP